MPWREWVRTVEIEPSLYAADFGHLADQVEVLLHAGARIFQFDCGDGHFVEPITMGPSCSRRSRSRSTRWTGRSTVT